MCIHVCLCICVCVCVIHRQTHSHTYRLLLFRQGLTICPWTHYVDQSVLKLTTRKLPLSASKVLILMVSRTVDQFCVQMCLLRVYLSLDFFLDFYMFFWSHMVNGSSPAWAFCWNTMTHNWHWQKWQNSHKLTLQKPEPSNTFLF